MTTTILKYSLRRKKCQKQLISKTSLAWNLHKNCAKVIVFIKDIISNRDFIQRHKVNKSDFTRQRSLPFPTLIIFLINLLRSSIQNELDKFFHTISKTDVPVRKITASAFCQARKKLKHSAFTELIYETTKYFYQIFSTNRWNGFRLLAIDGSTIQVPKEEEIEQYFGAWHPAKSDDTCPMARISHMFDVLNNITLDAIIASKSMGERTLAAKHLDHLDKNDFILLDRGYPAFWFFQLIVSKKANFCARLPIALWTKTVENFIASNQEEQIIDLESNYSSKKECIKLGLSTKPIKIRLVRIELDSGELEILATTLIDCEIYPYEIFMDLYFKRWPIEEHYKLWKSRIEIANFTGKSVLAVKQDFYARIFINNLTAILAHPIHENISVKHKNSKFDYKINWTQALAKMKLSAILLFFRENVIQIIIGLFKLFVDNSSVIRPGRKFPRKQKFYTKKYVFQYKPIS